MNPRDREQEIMDLDRRYLWHPYTQMSDYIANGRPLVIDRAEGSWLFDVHGRRFLDANSSWWCALLGHNHPRLVRALQEQSSRMCHVALGGIAHEPSARLAQELVQVAPAGLNHVFFTDNGSTAVEAAAKMALQYWSQNGKPERKRFVALNSAFHGETLGATALSGVEVFRAPFVGTLMDCVHVPLPQPSQPNANFDAAFEAVAAIIRNNARELAGVIVEPIVQGAAGMRMYEPEYLRHLQNLAQAHDIFLICDEVFTGYGRTGPMWASDHAGIVPDILCTAKGFTSGVLPMAAVLVTDRIFSGFFGEKSRAFYYGHTFCGHPLGAAIAREVLAIYRDEQILANAQPKALRIRQAFEKMAELPQVRSVRSLGMIGALDLATNGGYLGKGGWQVYEHALQLGAYLRPLGDTVYVAPPLNTSDADLSLLLDIVAESVRRLGA